MSWRENFKKNKNRFAFFHFFHFFYHYHFYNNNYYLFILFNFLLLDLKKWLKKNQEVAQEVAQVMRQEYDQPLYTTTRRNINIALQPNLAVS